MVTCSYAFLFCIRGYGCAERPAFPAPSLFFEGDLDAKLGRCSRRGKAKLCVKPAPSLRANGSRECAPDDRLREAIQRLTQNSGLLRSYAPRNDATDIPQRHENPTQKRTPPGGGNRAGPSCPGAAAAVRTMSWRVIRSPERRGACTGRPARSRRSPSCSDRASRRWTAAQDNRSRRFPAARCPR